MDSYPDFNLAAIALLQPKEAESVEQRVRQHSGKTNKDTLVMIKNLIMSEVRAAHFQPGEIN